MSKSIYPIIQTTKDNKYIRTLYCKEHILESGLTYHGVVEASKGIISTHKGYKFYRKKNIRNIESRNNYNYILGVDENKNIVHKYKDIKEVEFDLFDQENVRRCLKNEQVHHKGLVWIYSNEIEYINDKVFKMKNNKKRIKFQQFENGVLIHTYKSLKEAKDNGYSISAIHRCLNGKLNHYLGYEWIKCPSEDLENNHKVFIPTKQGEMK